MNKIDIIKAIELFPKTDIFDVNQWEEVCIKYDSGSKFWFSAYKEWSDSQIKWRYYEGNKSFHFENCIIFRPKGETFTYKQLESKLNKLNKVKEVDNA